MDPNNQTPNDQQLSNQDQTSSRPGMNSPAPKNKNVIIIAVVVALVLAIAAYFMFFANKDSVSDVAQQSQQSANANAIDMATLSSVVLNAPVDLTGYEKSERSTETYATYVTADGSCELSFGTVTAAQLPGGDTAEAIVQRQINGLRDNGMTIDGPRAGEALTLADAGDSSTIYKMPTLIFDFSKDNTRGTTHYSVAVLGSGDRAVINRVCANQTGEDIVDSVLEALNVKAREVTVTAER
jgi:hypothetical protein